jgi:hypothetical protein
VAHEVIDAFAGDDRHVVAYLTAEVLAGPHDETRGFLLDTSAGPERARTLHRRASAWHREFGAASEAIHHATAAGDAGDAGELSLRYWLEARDLGRLETLLAWLDGLPPETVTGDPGCASCGPRRSRRSGGSPTPIGGWKRPRGATPTAPSWPAPPRSPPGWPPLARSTGTCAET